MRKILISVMLMVLSSMLLLISCNREEPQNNGNSNGNNNGNTENPIDSTYNNQEYPSTAHVIRKAVADIDGNIYDAIQIGSKVWMAENLRTARYADGTAIPKGNSASSSTIYRYSPDANEGYAPVYGYLYNWQAVMGGSASSNSNPSGVQGICPNGWHVPSDAEWTQLTDYVSSQSQYLCNGDSNYIGKALADNALSWSYDTTTCAVGNMPSNNNATNFSALPAGDITSLGYFGFLTFTNFWTPTQYNNSRAYDRDIAWYVATVRRQDFEKVRGHSVRCLRNQ